LLSNHSPAATPGTKHHYIWWPFGARDGDDDYDGDDDDPAAADDDDDDDDELLMMLLTIVTLICVTRCYSQLFSWKELPRYL